MKITSAIVLAIFFVLVPIFTAKAVEQWPNPEYNKGEPLIENKESKDIKISIILENGTIYKMTEADKLKWKFFFEEEHLIKVKEVLVIFKSNKKENNVVANVKTKDGIFFGFFNRTDSDIIDDAMEATQDALRQF